METGLQRWSCKSHRRRREEGRRESEMSGENEANCPARVLGWREQTHRWHK